MGILRKIPVGLTCGLEQTKCFHRISAYRVHFLVTGPARTRVEGGGMAGQQRIVPQGRVDGPGPTFVIAAGALAALTLLIAVALRDASTTTEKFWLLAAAAGGMLGSVVILGLARQDLAGRRRRGYLPTRTDIPSLNGAVAAAWISGLWALLLVSYEWSRSFT